MTMMRCVLCTEPVDCEEFPDSLYIEGYADQCVCPFCVDTGSLRLETDFPEVRIYA